MVERRRRTGLVVIAGPADEVGQTFRGFATVEHLEVVVRYSNLVEKTIKIWSIQLGFF
jgi:hypothetical protein